MFKNAGTAPVIGVRNVVYWIMSANTSATASYGAVYPLPGVMGAKISHKTDSQMVSSDDAVSEIIYGQGSDDVELQQKNIPIDDLARILGHQIVGGVMVRNKDDIAPEVAFAYQSAKSNGAIEYDKYLCGRFTEPDKEADSNGEKVSPKYKTIKGTFYPRLLDGNTSMQMESDSLTFTQDKVANWFVAVDGTAPDAITVSSVPANNATGVLATAAPVLTFNNVIAEEAITLIKTADNSVVSVTKSFDVTGKILTITPTASLTSAGVYTIVISGVKDTYNQVLATSVIKFTVA